MRAKALIVAFVIFLLLLGLVLRKGVTKRTEAIRLEVAHGHGVAFAYLGLTHWEWDRWFWRDIKQRILSRLPIAYALEPDRSRSSCLCWELTPSGTNRISVDLGTCYQMVWRLDDSTFFLGQNNAVWRWENQSLVDASSRERERLAELTSSNAPPGEAAFAYERMLPEPGQEKEKKFLVENVEVILRVTHKGRTTRWGSQLPESVQIEFEGPFGRQQILDLSEENETEWTWTGGDS